MSFGARDPGPLGPFLDAQGFFVLDGGLATELEARGHDLGDPLWSARVLLEEPEAVDAVHRSFLAAGADCIATCTYQASFEGLARRGLSAGEAERILREAVRLARVAVEGVERARAAIPGGLRPLVAASLGPYGAYLADGSEYRGDYDATDSELRRFHERRWRTMADGDADLLACETVPSLREARVLGELLAESEATYAWISFSCRDETRISDGTPLVRAAEALDPVPGLVAIGINCTDPGLITPLIREARRGTSLPVLVYPNAGGRWDAVRKVWETPRLPIDWTTRAAEWLEAGAAGIGGCCRVGPGEIATLRRALEAA